MSIYKIINNEKKKITSQHLKSRLPVIFISLLIGLSIAFFQINDINTFSKIIIPTVITSLIAVFIGLKIGLKTYKDNHLEIIFKIENQRLSILKNEKEIISVDKENIIKIEQYINSSIIIFININPKKIFLNKNIENYESLINELNEIHKIDKVNKNPSNYLTIFATISILLLLVIFELSTQKYLILSSGFLLIIFMIFSFIKIFFNKYTDKRIKIASLAIFILLFKVINKIWEIL